MTGRNPLWLAPVLVVALAAPAAAQAPPDPPAATTQDDDPDLDPNDSQPDFYVATLATNLRLPKHKFAFRLTHRFLQTLGSGDFSDLASRLFGLDSGAQIGLDLKYGLVSGANIGIYRTSDRTIQLSAQYDAISQRRAPLGVGVQFTIDGTDNFTDEFSPALAFVLSRELGDRGAVYFQPSYVGNTNVNEEANTELEDYTMLAGVGARIRALRNTYLFVEASPRIAGYEPGVTLISFGFEQRAGGHVFQLNFSNGYGTTLAQVARGGSARDNWYLGFNLSRKFY